MKIFQFTNSFITIDDIRSVLIYPSRETSGVIRQHHCMQRWTLKVIYKDDGIFKAFFDNESAARQVYEKLMAKIAHENRTPEDEKRIAAAFGWSAERSMKDE